MRQTPCADFKIWQTVSLRENSTISLNKIMKLQQMVKYMV